MGVSMSTLGGWTIILCIAGYYAFRYIGDGRRREAVRVTAARQRLEDRQNLQMRKDGKDKAKRQRVTHSKDGEESDKSVKSYARAAADVPDTAGKQKTYLSSDDGVDNREFARQLANMKQGTSFTAPKKAEKRQKSVKQSKAEERDSAFDDEKVSAPSSTAGVDADDDQSSLTSPEVHAADAGDVSDMLEPSTTGPSVLRLTSAENVKPKQQKPAKQPEQTETKKQRQNRQKAEAAKLAREEAEQDRKVKMEAQRRLARVSEGRAAKDGSAFMAAQPATSAWSNNGANGTSNGNSTQAAFVPVQPLDTFSSANQTGPSKSSVPAVSKGDSWMSSVPSEEEQMDMLREEEWSTVSKKKPSKGRKKDAAGDSHDEQTVFNPQQVTPVTVPPVVTKTQSAAANGRPSKTFTQKSSFAALSTNDEPEVEEEWDV